MPAPGTVFYLTLAEASQYAEEDYLPVVRPQAEAGAGTNGLDQARSGGRRNTGYRLAGRKQRHASSGGAQSRADARHELRLPGAGGARGRDARSECLHRLRAGHDGHRGAAWIGAVDLPLRREIIVVHPRNALLAFFLALVPIGGFLAHRILAARRAALRAKV